ncbi:MAG: FtsQ-type POTRA domain-containing protein [Candidatus Marinimicrobia bacterium]|nr:FtsQ-type POTRA domain-containing protein [Candidatus Neomarinimicrobiota bacterium]MBL7023287.1 FtsQ-type POTRA domain-containing protein [Candidatus Neomarinimicrobiota bacterium]MBL7108881.1 FtsQ-type POTRA domain-containing protein [Candidatus Neomarinimicrobiota bacterium]
MSKKKYTYNKVTDWIFRMIIGISVVVLIYGAISYSNYIDIYKNKSIIVSGNKFVKTEKILSQINIPKNESLFSLNLTDLQNRICELDFVYIANISRTFPSTIDVEIIERNPIAYLEFEDEYVVLDITGEILPFNDEVKEYYKLPIIAGDIEDINLAEGIRQNTKLYRIYNLLNSINTEYNSFYSSLRKIEITKNLTILTNGYYKTKIYMDFTQTHNQIAILKEFESTVQKYRDLSDYQYIDLRVHGQVIVKERKVRQS